MHRLNLSASSNTLSFITHHLRGKDLVAFEVSTIPFLRECTAIVSVLFLDFAVSF